jgi:hypothetical protein
MQIVLACTYGLVMIPWAYSNQTQIIIKQMVCI